MSPSKSPEPDVISNKQNQSGPHLVRHPKAQDPYGYLVFGLFWTYAFLMGTSLTPFSPIFRALSFAFELDTSAALLTSVAFLFGKLLFSLPAGVILNIVGLRQGILGSLFVFVIGLLFRFGIEKSWFWVLVGQIFCGISATVIIAAQMQFCKIWFPVSTRGIFMTLTSFGFIFGSCLALFFSLFFVDPNSRDPIQIISGVFDFNMVNLVFGVILLGLHCMLFREHPESIYTETICETQDEEQAHRASGLIEPNMTEQLVDEISTESQAQTKTQTQNLNLYKSYVRKLWAQPMFQVCLAIYLLLNVANLAFTSNINFILEIQHYPAYTAAASVCTFIMGGLTGATLYSKLFMNSPSAVWIFAGYIASGLIAYSVLGFYVFSQGAIVIILSITFVYGFFMMMGTPTILEIFVRTVKSVPFTFINGLIYFAAQLVVTLVLGCLSVVYKIAGDEAGSKAIFIVIGGLFGLCVAAILRIRL